MYFSLRLIICEHSGTPPGGPTQTLEVHLGVDHRGLLSCCDIQGCGYFYFYAQNASVIFGFIQALITHSGFKIYRHLVGFGIPKLVSSG